MVIDAPTSGPADIQANTRAGVGAGAGASQEGSRSPLHFARFEFKYVLNAEQRRALESDLLFFLEHDPYVVDLPDNKYVVRSLYYDDPYFSAFHEKIDGLHTRSKFRIRTYARDPDEPSPRFLEIKGRHNNLVFKHRVPIRPIQSGWEQLRNEALTSAVLDGADPSDVRDQFTFSLFRKRLRPVALIDYQRRPYISKYDPNFRVTFDDRLSVTQSDRLFPGGEAAPRDLLTGYTVMEVKLQHHLPSWFHRLLQAHELRRVSISKICAGLETLGLAFDES